MGPAQARRLLFSVTLLKQSREPCGGSRQHGHRQVEVFDRVPFVDRYLGGARREMEQAEREGRYDGGEGPAGECRHDNIRAAAAW